VPANSTSPVIAASRSTPRRRSIILTSPAPPPSSSRKAMRSPSRVADVAFMNVPKVGTVAHGAPVCFAWNASVGSQGMNSTNAPPYA
jgi:hypothetical protein